MDCRTGRVYFPANLPYVSYAFYEGDDYGLQFRKNSRLLVVNGARRQDPEMGKFYYLWQTNTLSLVRSELKH